MLIQVLRLSVIAGVAALCAHAYTVPVNSQLIAERSRVPVGGNIELLCDVDGSYPEADVRWTKNGVTLTQNDRIKITGNNPKAQIIVLHANFDDSGFYGCHVTNGYGSQNSTVSITVEAIPLNCGDNPYFANCQLIVLSRFCNHKFYSRLCCKSCVEAGQIDLPVAKLK